MNEKKFEPKIRINYFISISIFRFFGLVDDMVKKKVNQRLMYGPNGLS